MEKNWRPCKSRDLTKDSSIQEQKSSDMPRCHSFNLSLLTQDFPPSSYEVRLGGSKFYFNKNELRIQ